MGDWRVRPDVRMLLREGMALMNAATIGRIVRYGVVGLSVAIFYSFAVVALVPLIQPLMPTVASVIAFCLALPLGFVLHRSFSFADRAGGAGQLRRFVVTNVSSFIVSVSGMYIITEWMHMSYLFGIAWNWVAVPTINFSVYLFWVFRKNAVPGSPEE